MSIPDMTGLFTIIVLIYQTPHHSTRSPSLLGIKAQITRHWYLLSSGGFNLGRRWDYLVITPKSRWLCPLHKYNRCALVRRQWDDFPLIWDWSVWRMSLLNELLCHNRSGEEWKKGRSVVSKQMMPSNVQRYTPGLNDVLARFTEHLKSTKDENDRISDITMPLRRLLVECMLPWTQRIHCTAWPCVILYMYISLTVSAKFVFDTNLHVLTTQQGKQSSSLKQ